MIVPGSSGLHQHLLVSTGKDGTIYVLDRDRLGKMTGSPDAACPAGRDLTCPAGPAGDCVVAELCQQFGAAYLPNIGAYFGLPAYFNGRLYYAGNGTPLRAFTVSPLAATAAQSSAIFGYPGTTPSISSNGLSDGIVWALEREKPLPFTFPDPTHLHAYQADANLTEIYNSRSGRAGFRSNDDPAEAGQFTTPTVAWGRVYIASKDSVSIYGLFNVATPVISVADQTVFNAPITVSISEATSGANLYYTLDGTDPTTSSPPYAGPFTVSSSTLIKARAFVPSTVKLQLSEVAGAQVFHSICGVKCPNGCCQNGQCVSTGFPACGNDGAACSTCDTVHSNQCSSTGACICAAAGHACPAGTRCGGSLSACVCDANTCASGCCTGGFDQTCVSPPGLSQCGAGGGSCSACSATAADTCSASGACSCGGGAACASPNTCVAGSCRPPAPAYEGYFDSASCQYLSGWAWDRNSPTGRIGVDLYLDGAIAISNTPANLYRADLLAAGKGDGYHGFAATTPVSFKDARPHNLDAYIAGTSVRLGGGPISLRCGPTIEWIQPAENSWGPAGTLTVAGFAYGGGNATVQLLFRDATNNDPWQVVAYQATVSNNSWSNTIGPAPINKCHTFQAQAIYDGAQTPVFTYYGSSSVYCHETSRVAWVQPQPRAGYGPPGSLIIAGSATGSTPDSQSTSSIMT